jgi:hypothetical protein
VGISECYFPDFVAAFCNNSEVEADAALRFFHGQPRGTQQCLLTEPVFVHCAVPTPWRRTGDEALLRDRAHLVQPFAEFCPIMDQPSIPKARTLRVAVPGCAAGSEFAESILAHLVGRH